ncbi:MAG: tetratricopeptide repeat protein [Chloroflexia bacterium]|nr:tetratricopeptide repeat protein [Chloroflexia bacterium]
MSRLKLTFLGASQVVLDEQPIQKFRSVKVLALLAYLAIEADRAHPRDSLAALLWAESTDSTARQNLRQSIYQLRQLLERGEEPDNPFLLISRQEAQFNLESEHWLDTAAFASFLRQGQLEAALALYRGDLLPGLFVEDSIPFEEWLSLSRERLHRQAIEALRKVTHGYVERKDWARVQAYAQQQLELEPWQEEAYRQLMRALAHSGQRSRALAQYERCRQVLKEELNIEPSAETHALYEEIKAETFAVERAPPQLPPGNLPHQLTPLFGRTQELLQIGRLLDDPGYRLLTLTGEGGVGKTHLALVAAEQNQARFADGSWWVALSSVGLDEESSPSSRRPSPQEKREAVALAIGKSVGLPFSGQEGPQGQLLDYLRGKEMLLVLDNFEHLIETSELLLDILWQAPQVRLLVTSRERLNFQAEYVLRLGGLPVPESADEAEAAGYSSVQLFTERAGRTLAGFILNQHTLPHVVHICQIVEGLPLAIELAAAWVEVLDCASIAESIQQNLDFLSTRMRDIPERHRSMRATFETSWRLLADAEKRTLAQLTVFAGGFDLPAALAVSQASPREIKSLVEKSLLKRGESERYNLHEILRPFVAEKLAQPMDPDGSPTIWSVESQPHAAEGEGPAYDRHSAYYLRLATDQGAALFGPRPQEAAEVLQRDWANLQQACYWAAGRGHVELLAGSLGVLARFLLFRGLLQQGRLLFQTAAERLAAYLKAPSAAGDDALQRLLGRMYTEEAHFLNEQARYDEARQKAQQGLALAQRYGDPLALAWGKLQRGWSAACQGNHPSAYSEIKEGLGHLDQARETNDPPAKGEARPAQIERVEANGLHMLGQLTEQQGFILAAKDYYQQALDIYQRLEDRRGETMVLYNKGQASLHAGDYSRAQRTFRQVLQNVRDMGDPGGEAYALNSMGTIATLLGSFIEAQTYLRQALHLYRQIGHRQGESSVLLGLGRLYLYVEKAERACEYQQQALRIAQEIGDSVSEAYIQLHMGHSLSELEQLEKAAAVYEAARHLHQQLEQISLVTAALAGLARVALLEGRQDKARRYVEDVLDRLALLALDPLSEPCRIYLHTLQVLQALQDARALDIAARAYHGLQAQAEKIHPLEQRRSFLENIPLHREIMRLYEEGRG